MSKIRELTHEEAARLRRLILRRFLLENAHGKRFRVSSFKGAYEDLRDDIESKVSSAATSISLTRLRKLFYYTDPSICPAEQLDKPSFGRDFIEVLSHYIGDTPPPSLTPTFPIWKRSLNWRIGIPLLAALLLLGALAARFFQARPDKNWKEDFEQTSVDSLQAKGFEWMDYEPNWWSKQLQKGKLTLYTLRGDYWYDEPDTPTISNLLCRKINGRKCKITVKLDGFDPTQDFQQAGIFLLDSKKTRDHNIRFTLAACSSCSPPRQVLQMVKNEHGTVFEKFVVAKQISPKASPTAQSLWLRMEYESGQVRFFYHWGAEYSSFQEIATMDIDYEPAFVGLAAFRGLKDGSRKPNIAASLPVFVDYLKVESGDH